MTSRTSFTERNLEMQGFRGGTSPGVRPWLRLTPSLSTAWISTGTVLGSPAVLLGFALVSAFGASRPRHPFDRLARAALPENPPPRRFAMALAAAWAAAAAALFATRRRRGGRIAGALLGVAGASVASTHFCLGSWVYQRVPFLAHFGSRRDSTVRAARGTCPS